MLCSVKYCCLAKTDSVLFALTGYFVADNYFTPAQSLRMYCSAFKDVTFHLLPGSLYQPLP